MDANFKFVLLMGLFNINGLKLHIQRFSRTFKSCFYFSVIKIYSLALFDFICVVIIIIIVIQGQIGTFPMQEWSSFNCCG